MNQSRRKLIAAIGDMTAGQAYLDDNVKADSNPVGLVADCGSFLHDSNQKHEGNACWIKSLSKDGNQSWNYRVG